jgi:hypothetical protein
MPSIAKVLVHMDFQPKMISSLQNGNSANCLDELRNREMCSLVIEAFKLFRSIC